MSTFFLLAIEFLTLTMVCFLVIVFSKNSNKTKIFVITGIICFIVSLVFLDVATKEDEKKIKIQTEEKALHNNLLILPEGRYILDHIVSADSAKILFTLQLPGVAKRKAEVIAYDDSPIYWNEWQVESAVPGDTLIIFDIWNTDSTYSRSIHKMDPSFVGWGHVTFEEVIDPEWQKVIDWQKKIGEK